MLFVVVPFMKPAGMALYPFILLKKRGMEKNAVLVHHEQIHLQQQKEMLLLPFYLAYIACYLYNLSRYGDHYTAYMQIPFEREAYRHEAEPGYLIRRKFWGWMRC